MKKLCFFLSIMLSAAFYAQVPTNGLISSWNFNGNANDATGANHGIVNGAVLTADRCGNANSAYHFNGSSSFIMMPMCGPTGTVSRSLSYWMRSSYQGLSPVVAFDYGSPGYGSAFQMVYNYNCAGTGIDVGDHALIRGTGCILNNSWHHVVAVYNAAVGQQIGDVDFYIDGIHQSAVSCYVTGTTSIINTGTVFPVTIGRGANMSARFFDGDLDDFFLYNRALTPQEVQQLYTPCGAGISGPQSVCPFATAIYSVAPGSSSYNWTLPNGWTGASSGNTIQVTAGANPGIITVVTGTVPAGGCANSSAIAVSLSSILPASSASVICTGESATLTVAGGTSYTWQPGAVSGSAIVVSPSLSMVYTVSGMPLNCTNTSVSAVTVTVKKCTGIQNNGADELFFSMYPNPNDGVFSISVSEPSFLKITNSLGQLVYESKTGTGMVLVDLSAEPAGIYFVSIMQLNRSKTVKLIKN